MEIAEVLTEQSSEEVDAIRRDVNYYYGRAENGTEAADKFRRRLGPNWINKLTEASDRDTDFPVWTIIRDQVRPRDALTIAKFIARPHVLRDVDESIKDDALNVLISFSGQIPERQRHEVVQIINDANDELVQILSSVRDPARKDWIQRDIFNCVKFLLLEEPEKADVLEGSIQDRSKIFTDDFVTQVGTSFDDARENLYLSIQHSHYMSDPSLRPSILDAIHFVPGGSGGDDEDYDSVGPRGEAVSERKERLEEIPEEKIKEYSDRAVEFVGRFGNLYPKEAVPALNLHIYNFIKERPDVDDLSLVRELRKFGSMVKDEIDSNKNIKIPSIGMEIELFGGRLPLDSIEAECLRNMGVIVKFEVHSKTELEIPPSSSPLVQARILFELKSAGIVPSDLGFAPLHVNLGIEKQSWSSPDQSIATDISDLLTCAFVPGGRVERNDYNIAMELRPLSETTHSIKNPGENIVRAEFRSPKVFGPRTYRLLTEVHRLSEFLEDGSPHLSELSHSFGTEVEQLRKKYGLGKGAATLAYKDLGEKLKDAWKIKKATAERQLEDPGYQGPPNLIDDARALMTRYSMAIFKADHPEPKQLSFAEELGVERIREQKSKTEEESAKEANELELRLWRRMESDVLGTAKVGERRIPLGRVSVGELSNSLDMGQRTIVEGGFFRKAVVKRISNPGLTDFVMVKETTGTVPVYMFNFVEKNPHAPKVDIENDERTVRLARVHAGTSIKGEEYETVYSFLPRGDGAVTLDALVHEENREVVVTAEGGTDFVLRGYAAKIDGNTLESALYTTLQLSEWGMDSVTLGGVYKNGMLTGFSVRSERLTSLPFERAQNQEDPGRLLERSANISESFDAVNLTAEQSLKLISGGITLKMVNAGHGRITLEVGNSHQPEAGSVRVEVPVVINNSAVLGAIQSGQPIPNVHSYAYQLPLPTGSGPGMEVSEIRFDPELDIDLNESLNALLAGYGPNLREVYLYGANARGQKRYRGDIDLLAVLSDEADIDTQVPGFVLGKKINEELTSLHSRPYSGAIKDIDIHIINEAEYEKPTGQRLEYFLGQIKVQAIRLWSST